MEKVYITLVYHYNLKVKRSILFTSAVPVTSNLATCETLETEVSIELFNTEKSGSSGNSITGT